MKEVLDDIERWRAGGHRVAVARVVGARGLGPARPGRHDGRERRRRGRGLGVGRLRRGRGRRGVARGARGHPRAGASSPSATPTTRRSRSASRAAAPSTSSSSPSTGDDAEPTPVYDALRDALRDGRARSCSRPSPPGPTCGHELGAKLLASPDGTVVGTLGDPDLDRVVTRDALGELEAGLTSTRHYGAHGEAREDTVSVFIESFAPPPRMVIFGAVDFTAALARVGKVLGYRVVVCDARAGVRDPRSGSRWPTRSSTTGPTATSRRSATSSDRATRCACSPTTPSSTCPRSSARSPPTSATSARWARGARTTSASSGSARRASTDDELARIHGADRARHRRPHARGDRDLDLRRDHRAHRHRAASLRDLGPSADGTTSGSDPRAEAFADGPRASTGRRAAVGRARRRGSGFATAAALADEGVHRRDLQPGPGPDRRRGGRRSVPVRSRSSPTSRTEDGGGGVRRATRGRRSAASTSWCANARRAAAGHVRVAPSSTRYRQAFELNCLSHDRDVPRGGAGDAGPAVGEGARDHVGGGAPADRRPDPLEHRARRAHRLPQDPRPRGRRRRRHRELAPAGLARHRADPRLHSATPRSRRRSRRARRPSRGLRPGRGVPVLANRRRFVTGAGDPRRRRARTPGLL